MFTVKIQEAAKRAGLEAVFVKSRDIALAKAQEQPPLMILDLNEAGLDALALIEALKADEATRAIRLLGYVSHVQTDVRQAALDRGCDVVLPRSAFSQNLTAILQKYTGQ
jgi:CheY-like chemotaxis protein